MNVSPSLIEEYLKGTPIEFKSPKGKIWQKVVPYSEPNDIYRLSHPNYKFRIAAPAYKFLGVIVFRKTNNANSIWSQLYTDPDLYIQQVSYYENKPQEFVCAQILIDKRDIT